MPNRKQHVQVGLLFIVSVAVLVWGVLWFKEFQIGESTYELVGVFPTTSGLLKGDAVEVKGVPSGKVADIRFENGKAMVVMQISRTVELHAGTRAAIESMGLMGQKIISIYPGPISGDPLPPGTVLEGVYRGGMSDLMGELGGALTSFERVANRVDSLLVSLDEPGTGQIAATIENLERVTGELAVFLENNRGDMGSAVENMNKSMENLNGMLEGRSDQFGRALDGASTVISRLDTTLTVLDDTAERVDRLLSQVENGEGTLGKVMQDEALYYMLVLTLRDAKELLQDVRENPKKYFKVSIF